MGGFALGSSFLLPSHFPSSSYTSHHSHSLFLYVKDNSNNKVNLNPPLAKSKKRTTLSACSRQDDQNDVVFSKKRAVLLVGISVLPFLQLRARALDGLVTSKESDLKNSEESPKLPVQIHSPPNPFLSFLNGLGIFGTGVLGALYGLAQKEKKAAMTTIESMEAKLKEKDGAIMSLEKKFESELLSEQEERARQIMKAKEEQQILLNQLSSANSTITGLGQELKREKRTIEELKAWIESLETNLSKTGEDKKAVEQELEEKLNSIELLQDKITLLGAELKEKEDNIERLSSSLAQKESEMIDLNAVYVQTRDELTKALNATEELRRELLENKGILDSTNSLVDELNSNISSLKAERDDINRKLHAMQLEYSDLKSLSEKNAALNVKKLRETEDELNQVKEKLLEAQSEVRDREARIEDLTQEWEDTRKMLDKEESDAKNLRLQLQNTQEILGKSRHEASDLAKQFDQMENKYAVLEAELLKVQSEYAAATERFQKELVTAKQSAEALASELASVKEQLNKATEELHNVTRELEVVTRDHENVKKELVNAYKKAEVAANDLKEEKTAVSLLNKELQNLEKQILMDKEARKSLEADLEEATRSLDEMSRNALILSGDLERANSRISGLEVEKDVLYKSLSEQKNASKEAIENMEDAHNMVLRLGKEREALEKKAKVLEGELASAKGEILRLRSHMNSVKANVNDQPTQKVEAPDNVPASAKRVTRRRRAGP